MVRPGGSRPARLSQRHVDALVRGGDDAEAVRIMRAARAPEAFGGDEVATEAGRPVELSADEMDTIKRSGQVSGAVRERIASAGREAHERDERAGPPSRDAPTAPSAEPPR